MPKRLTKEEATATDTYAKFIAEPFETGYGHTIGNSLRRVLLSSLEGAAITSIKIDGAKHEFATIDGVVEDVTDIVLNLKKVMFKDAQPRAPDPVALVNKEGEVTAGDIQLNQKFELVNPKQHICTLDKKKKFEMELEVKVGRGFLPGDENKSADQADRRHCHRLPLLAGDPRALRRRKRPRRPAHRLRPPHSGNLDRRPHLAG